VSHQGVYALKIAIEGIHNHEKYGTIYQQNTGQNKTEITAGLIEILVFKRHYDTI
jgi:hypothetical protein